MNEWFWCAFLSFLFFIRSFVLFLHCFVLFMFSSVLFYFYLFNFFFFALALIHFCNYSTEMALLLLLLSCSSYLILVSARALASICLSFVYFFAEHSKQLLVVFCSIAFTSLSRFVTIGMHVTKYEQKNNNNKYRCPRDAIVLHWKVCELRKIQFAIFVCEFFFYFHSSLTMRKYGSSLLFYFFYFFSPISNKNKTYDWHKEFRTFEWKKNCFLLFCFDCDDSKHFMISGLCVCYFCFIGLQSGKIESLNLSTSGFVWFDFCIFFLVFFFFLYLELHFWDSIIWQMINSFCIFFPFMFRHRFYATQQKNFEPNL